MAEDKKKYSIQSGNLAYDWHELNEKYIDCQSISFNEFKELFLETFGYFYETVKSNTIFRHDVLLIKELSSFYAFEDYPKGMTYLESGVCMILVDGLINALSHDVELAGFDDLKKGRIMVEISRPFGKMDISLDDFENSLKKAMDAYAEEYNFDEYEE